MAIICIDDDKNVLNILEKMFKKIGHDKIYTIHKNNSILLKIENIVNTDIKIDAIFLDSTLHVFGDGIINAKKIKEKYPNIPIFLLSGYSKEIFSEDLHYFNDFIQKPFDFRQLRNICCQNLN